MTDHGSDHDHAHHPESLAPIEARVAAIESVLAEKGLFDTERLDAIVENFEHQEKGARIVLSRVEEDEHLRHLGVAVMDGARVTEILEKPESPPSPGVENLSLRPLGVSSGYGKREET